MTLSALIRKRDTGGIATAIPAIDGSGGRETVARIATIAVANPKEWQTVPPATVGAGDAATIRHSPASITASEESAIRRWLAQIEETDPATIAEVIAYCQRDMNARQYFIGRASEPKSPASILQVDSDVDRNNPIDEPADDRRRCSQCLNLRGRVCSIAKPERGALVVANIGYRPQPDTLQRCAGYQPNTTDDDQRPGRERWLGLTDTKGNK